MYEAHFGLSARPFSETLSPSGYVALPSRESALRRLRYGLEHGQGPALLFGPPGSGKTVLARALARALGVRTTVHLVFPALPADELVAFLADELEGTTVARSAAPTTGESVRRLGTVLARQALRGERPLLIVDEAHLIDDPRTFETLRLLLNFATAGPPDLSLLIVGGAEVLLRLSSGLADRLTARCALGPLSEDEAASYVQGRLTAAGARQPLFDPETLSALYYAAAGLPRRINLLADLALLIAFAEGRARPDPRIVAIAAREANPDAWAA